MTKRETLCNPSIVTELLSSAGKLEKDDLNAKVSRLTMRIEDIKKEVQESLRTRYVDFLPGCDGASELSTRLINATSEVEAMISKVETEIKPYLSNTAREYEDLSKQLQQTNILAEIVEKLAKIHECLEQADEKQEAKDFLSAAHHLERISDLLLQASSHCNDRVEILKALKIEQRVRKEKLIYDLSELWNQNIVWAVPRDISASTQCIKLEVASVEDKQISNLLQALHFLGHLKEKIKTFGKSAMTLLLRPVTMHTSDIKIKKVSGQMLLEVSYQEDAENRPDPFTVYKNLEEIFKFFYDSFMKIPIRMHMDENKMDIEKDDYQPTLMQMLGNIIGEEFCECLTRECLCPAVPSSSSQLDEYNAVIKETIVFQNFLVDIGFLNKEQTSILDYAHNVDVLFANKMCQEKLVHARSMMLEDLHNTMTVDENDNEFAEQLDNDPAINISVPAVKEGLNKSPFRFPKCQISVSVNKLLKLIHKVLMEASTSSPQCTLRLFYTARNICELYCNVVPTYHRHNITTLPQQTAIFHNNCMYLAHHLQTIGHQYSSRFPESHKGGVRMFVDIVHPLRKLGTDAFLAQMRQQKQLLLSFLQEGGAFQNISSDQNLSIEAERSVRQCLHQLHLLKQVWGSVLPVGVYCRAIGTLLNVCLDEIILRVCTLEDIPVNAASEFVTLFNTILTQAPDLLKVSDVEENSVIAASGYTPKWLKFKELQIVLGASMHDIVERWASGKGPLAAEFSADEVKHLIRALFQNTDRRAIALAKIR